MNNWTPDKNLNKEQTQAVKHKLGPLLIIAGAGTGKTTVITERIKLIIEKGLVKPNEILALTFTEKAAKEMEERVDIALPFGYTQMWISTFHSFCDRILRREALHIGIDPNYKLATQAETVQFVRSNLFKFNLDYFRPLGNPTKFVSGMIQHFSRLQDEDITPTEYLSWVNSKKDNELEIELKKWRELAEAYKTYNELKVKESVMDFGDLIVKTLELFRKRPNVLKEYRKQFKHILVDEFQDTNVAQYELLKLLAPPKDNPNLTVVGDDSQSVYKFRGAAISNILYFKKDYPNAKTLVLTINYRSTQKILDSAYKLIQFNNPDTLESKLGIDKNLKSTNKSSEEEVLFIHQDRVENEAEEVAKEIGKLVNHTGKVNQVKSNNSINQLTKLTNNLQYRDFAILVRANNHADPFMRALSRHGIPYQFLGPGRLFKQPEIIDLIAYLKILNDFEDSVSFYRVLSIDYLDVPQKELIRIVNFAKKKNTSLFEICDKHLNEIYLENKTKEKIGQIVSIINKHLELVKKETAGQLLYYFLENTGLLSKLLNPDTPYAENQAKNISKFFDKLKTYEVDHENARVPAVVDWIELSGELGESPLAANTDWNDINAINLLTVHSAKGLEFSVVFLVNLVSQRFPTSERREQIPIPDELVKEVLPIGDYHIQEERRLFYVGMTRAKKRLYFTAADYYGEGKREKKLSPFVFEALGDKAISAEFSKDEVKQLSFLDYEPQVKPFVALAKEGALQSIHIDYLSYSQIETFRICPLHYKLKYIYKLPTPPSSSQSFGNTFHITMKKFYEALIAKEKPTENLFYKILEENWINEGYLSKSHEKGSFEKAKRFLKFYLDNYFDPKIKPIALEQPFLVKAGDIKIGGKIDRVDLSNETLSIIDYKTGATALSQKEADNDLQLSIYALAATSIPEAPFNRKPEKVKLKLMYFDTPQIVTTVRTKEQLEKAKEEILKYRVEIENSDFKCSGNMLCNTCEYKLFCGEDK